MHQYVIVLKKNEMEYYYHYYYTLIFIILCTFHMRLHRMRRAYSNKTIKKNENEHKAETEEKTSKRKMHELHEIVKDRKQTTKLDQ